MAYSPAQKRSIYKHRTKIDRIDFFVPAGYKDIYKKAAAAAGMSLNGFIRACVDDTIKRQQAASEDE